jgi:hypothetical protein
LADDAAKVHTGAAAGPRRGTVISIPKRRAASLTTRFVHHRRPFGAAAAIQSISAFV